jgi:parvulin-like peptidyl-prolyl isomerase
VHARHILVRVTTGEGDEARAQALADRVRGEAVKGTDFGTLVRRYSKYQGAQTPDGDIGFVPVSSLQNNIRAGLDTLEAGEISPVLQNAVGFNIFKLTDRKPERAYQLEEIRAELPDFVTKLKFSERFEDWVKGLRTKAHIQIKV